MSIRERIGLALLVAGAVVHLWFYDFAFEDLYITLRYGRNLAHGVGLRFNPGETVDGFTSFLWVLVSALGEGVGSPTLVLRLLSCTGALGLVVCLHQELIRHVEPLRGPVGAALALRLSVVAILVAAAPLAYWAMTGMEAVPFVLLLFAAASLLTRPARTRSIWSIWTPGLLLGVACLLRPEGIGFAVAIAFGVALSDWRRALATLGAALALFAPYFVWHWAHFGYPFPNTYYAKASLSGSILWRGLLDLEEFGTSHMAWLLMAGAAVTTARRWREPWVAIYASVALAAVANAVLVGGDTFPLYRFFLPGLAPLLILFGAALGDLREYLASHSRAASVVPTTIAVAMAIWVAAAPLHPALSLVRSPRISARQAIEEIAALNRGYVVVGRWLRETLPPDTWISVNAAGIVPYESRLPTLDMLGLNDAHIAHVETSLGGGAVGHEKFDADYVLRRRPEVIILGLPAPSRLPIRSQDELDAFVASWARYLPGDGALYLDPRFRADYQPRSVRIAPGQWINLFILRDRLEALFPERR